MERSQTPWPGTIGACWSLRVPPTSLHSSSRQWPAAIPGLTAANTFQPIATNDTKWREILHLGTSIWNKAMFDHVPAGLFPLHYNMFKHINQPRMIKNCSDNLEKGMESCRYVKLVFNHQPFIHGCFKASTTPGSPATLRSLYLWSTWLHLTACEGYFPRIQWLNHKNDDETTNQFWGQNGHLFV